MTPVPVVSTPLNTRTEWRGWVEGAAPGWSVWTPAELTVGRNFSRIERRLVADPAFVVLPEFPDLTCRTCKGEGYDLSDIEWESNCPSCGGSGVSPVYAATWQWRHVYADGPLNWHALDDTCLDEVHAVADQRRQVVEWRARRVEPLPVVDDSVRTAIPDASHIVVHRTGEASLWSSTGRRAWLSSTIDEPWAVDLQPNMCVLRLSEWEHLEQPYTEMVEKGPSAYEYERDVPLSVPDGVLSWIELA